MDFKVTLRLKLSRWQPYFLMSESANSKLILVSTILKIAALVAIFKMAESTNSKFIFMLVEILRMALFQIGGH